MSYQKRLSTILARGYFPGELPPVFSTSTFGQHVNEILDDWDTKQVFHRKSGDKVPSTRAFKRGAYTYTVPHADIEIISKPKRGYERRNIHITHPIPQALLSYELAKHWKSVQKWLTRQVFSLDEICVSDRYERALKGINFRAHRAKKAHLTATSDWIIKTDISRFYPTIYTHSISWAAYGKERVKDNLKLYQGALADRLDILVRACNRNQTIGVPIGPDTSRIIAEVISSRIDSEFQRREPTIPMELVDRRQDDWLIGVTTLEKAEAVLATITAIYRDFGLEINGNKTSIDRIIAASDAAWISEIEAFLSHRTGPIRASRLRELLSLGLRMQSQNPNEPVINYILSIIEAQNVTSGDIEVVESFLLKSAVLAPISMKSYLSNHFEPARQVEEDFTKADRKSLYDVGRAQFREWQPLRSYLVDLYASWIKGPAAIEKDRRAPRDSRVECASVNHAGYEKQEFMRL